MRWLFFYHIIDHSTELYCNSHYDHTRNYVLLMHFSKITQINFGCRSDEARQPLSRKVSIASSKINPYRMVIVLRLVILAFFLRYRIMHPVHDAIGLWLTSIICEIWFAVSWILDQFPKWFPIERETYLDRLSLRFYYFPSKYFSVEKKNHIDFV